MSLKIRLAKIGKKGKRLFRFVVAPTRSKRDGRPLDLLGFYNPRVNPPQFRFDWAKYEHWLARGAKPSEGVRKILKERK